MELWKMGFLSNVIMYVICGETGWCLTECKQLGGNWRSLKFSGNQEKILGIEELVKHFSGLSDDIIYIILLKYIYNL